MNNNTEAHGVYVRSMRTASLARYIHSAVSAVQTAHFYWIRFIVYFRTIMNMMTIMMDAFCIGHELTASECVHIAAHLIVSRIRAQQRQTGR